MFSTFLSMCKWGNRNAIMSFRQIIVVFVLLRSINYKCEGRLIKTVLLNYFFFFTFNCFNLYLGTRTAHCPSKSTNKIKNCELSTMFWNVVLLFHSADISSWNNCSFNAAQSTVLTSGWPKPLCNLANSGENSPSNEKRPNVAIFHQRAGNPRSLFWQADRWAVFTSVLSQDEL